MNLETRKNCLVHAEVIECLERDGKVTWVYHIQPIAHVCTFQEELRSIFYSMTLRNSLVKEHNYFLRRNETAIVYSSKMWVHLCQVTSVVWLFATLWTVASQAPQSMGILQARILEWVPMPFSRESSWLRDQTCIFYVSCISNRFFTTSVTWEAQRCEWEISNWK